MRSLSRFIDILYRRPKVDMILKRNQFRDDGIFGELTTAEGKLVAVTLEHAYDAGLGNGSYKPKMKAGVYKCYRGLHRLHGMTSDFETFEIEEGPEHDNILFHAGNYNKDSEGCVLLGSHIAIQANGDQMISLSKVAFAKFMEMQKDVKEFTLKVIGD